MNVYKLAANVISQGGTEQLCSSSDCVQSSTGQMQLIHRIVVLWNDMTRKLCSALHLIDNL